ncbi:hypothetical protein KFL_004690060 [Klebsormidium nitens]|uniref:Uncharacterized protein n=1 Tax=Klebsormidium nitens TaxID=105231 RepID=A0A1Y1IE93_KLENI|nr:hypothetical protein KFL_004690060 [Klebsormidium nitens]|eukprot:GAQ88913.1 hypothetical protein KFL_004690060 [Klebsormidium nitens]
MEATLALRTSAALSKVGGMRAVLDSSVVRPCSVPAMKAARQCTLGALQAQGLLPMNPQSNPLQLCRQLQGHRMPVSRTRGSRSERARPIRSSTRPEFQPLPDQAQTNPSPSLESSPQTPPFASQANTPPVRLPAPLLLALRIPACQQALTSASPHFRRLTASAIAAGRLLLWFVSGRYIPSQMKVLFTLLRAERFYRKRIRTIDGRQLLHELNFFPECPDLSSVFPVLGYAFVLSRAVLSSVSALGSINLLHGSAGVPGLPEVELPTIGRSVAYEYPDKSDQPETPGYQPLGEWVGPRGMKPWERNMITITPEERKKLWEKNFKEESLNPYNSTPKERKILIALAAISSILTQMWIMLHALLLPFIFLGLMYAFEKPLFWLLSHLYKARKLVGDYKGPLSQG